MRATITITRKAERLSRLSKRARQTGRKWAWFRKRIGAARVNGPIDLGIGRAEFAAGLDSLARDMTGKVFGVGIYAAIRQ